MKFSHKFAVTAAFFSVLGLFGLLSFEISRWHRVTVARELICDHNSVNRVYFSSQDNLSSRLITLIDEEKKRLRCAVYLITDKQIADAFIRAAKRGVQVEFVVDRCYGQSRFSKVAQLANASLPIWVYQPTDSGLMHNKFCIFDETLDGRALLWSGSFNFTRSASERNEENVIITDDKALQKFFADYFSYLKTRSIQISGQQTKQAFS